MASDPLDQRWGVKVRDGHVRLRWVSTTCVQASLHGLLMDVVGTPIRARARGRTIEAALRGLWTLIEHVPLVAEEVGSDAE